MSDTDDGWKPIDDTARNGGKWIVYTKEFGIHEAWYDPDYDTWDATFAEDFLAPIAYRPTFPPPALEDEPS